MRKLFALLMAVLMIGSLAVGALAEGVDDSVPETTAPEQEEQATTSLTLEYQINSGTAPKETFTFEKELTGFVDSKGNAATSLTNIAQPTVTIGAVTFDKTAGKKTLSEQIAVTVVPGNCQLGVYTYKVNQVDQNTAGVTYDTGDIYMVVTIYRETGDTDNKAYQVSFHQGSVTGNKITKLTNSYDAGTLAITKTISGNMATMTETFKFSVTFTTDGTDKFINAGTDHLPYNSKNSGITVTAAEGNTATSATYTFELGHEKTLTFANIPAGTKYVVKELDSEGYTATITGDAEGTVTAAGEHKVAIENKLDRELDMGVVLESAPYVLMLSAAAIGLGTMMIKKREEG